jgi:hypothetical protein
MSETNTPQNELLEASSLPHHVQEFIALSEGLETAMKTKNAVDITMARNRLRLLFVSLDEKAQQDIQQFIQKEIAGIRIQDERGTINNSIHRALNVPVMGMHALAETVPQFAAETLRLIVTTVGLAGVGVYKAGRTIYNRALAA